MNRDSWQYSTKIEQLYLPIRYSCLGVLNGYVQSNGCRKEIEDGTVELNVLALQGAVTGRHEVDNI